jgi:hypothetical protein
MYSRRSQPNEERQATFGHIAAKEVCHWYPRDQRRVRRAQSLVAVSGNDLQAKGRARDERSVDSLGMRTSRSGRRRSRASAKPIVPSPIDFATPTEESLESSISTCRRSSLTQLRRITGQPHLPIDLEAVLLYQLVCHPKLWREMRRCCYNLTALRSGRTA